MLDHWGSVANARLGKTEGPWIVSTKKAGIIERLYGNYHKDISELKAEVVFHGENLQPCGIAGFEPINFHLA
jgi:hypothetical protein